MGSDGKVYISCASEEAFAFQHLFDNAEENLNREFSKYITLQHAGKKKLEFHTYLDITWTRIMPEVLRDVLYYLARWFYEEPKDRETIIKQFGKVEWQDRSKTMKNVNSHGDVVEDTRSRVQKIQFEKKIKERQLEMK